MAFYLVCPDGAIEVVEGDHELRRDMLGYPHLPVQLRNIVKTFRIPGREIDLVVRIETIKPGVRNPTLPVNGRVPWIRGPITISAKVIVSELDTTLVLAVIELDVTKILTNHSLRAMLKKVSRNTDVDLDDCARGIKFDKPEVVRVVLASV